jgi:hypothetical protein
MMRADRPRSASCSPVISTVTTRLVAPGGGGDDREGTTARASGLLAIQAGSATSTRLRGEEPNADNRIRVVDREAHVTVRLRNGRGRIDAAAPAPEASQGFPTPP